MDINKMMKQAQMMQAKVMQAQEELEASEFAHEYQGIKLKVNGKKQILEIKIDEDLIDTDNKDMLEDMLVVALNEVFRQVDEKTENIMSQATGNLKIPGM